MIWNKFDLRLLLSATQTGVIVSCPKIIPLAPRKSSFAIRETGTAIVLADLDRFGMLLLVSALLFSQSIAVFNSVLAHTSQQAFTVLVMVVSRVSKYLVSSALVASLACRQVLVAMRLIVFSLLNQQAFTIGSAVGAIISTSSILVLVVSVLLLSRENIDLVGLVVTVLIGENLILVLKIVNANAILALRVKSIKHVLMLAKRADWLSCMAGRTKFGIHDYSLCADYSTNRQI